MKPQVVLPVHTVHDSTLAVAVPVRTLNWDFPMLQQAPVSPRSYWTTGLFRCGDHCVPNGCMSFVCPCVALAQIFARMGMRHYWGMLLVMAWAWIAMATAAVLFCVPLVAETDDSHDVMQSHSSGLVLPLSVLWGGNALAVLVIRRSIRHTFNIPNTEGGDCLVACCCTPCAIAQAATHLQSYTPGACSFQRPDVLPAFLES